MELAILGLGRMGGNKAVRLLRAGHRVVAWNRHKDPTLQAMNEGAVGAYEKKPDIIKELTIKPRVVWFMLPAGKVTGEAIDEVAPMLEGV